MVYGKCHRLDGPAIEYADGSKSWFINGQKISTINHFIKVIL